MMENIGLLTEHVVRRNIKKMKTKTITGVEKLNNIYACYSLVAFHPVDDKLALRGFQTTCKEEIGSQCVRKKYNRFIIILSDKLTDEQVGRILDYVNTKEKEIKVLKTIIQRVKDKSGWLFIEHSHRWSRNSVAHSILVTWLRLAIACEIDNMYRTKDIDEQHLASCSWLLDIVKKRGLRIFGTNQHSKYDIGMVSFMYRVKEINGFTSTDGEPYSWEYNTDDEWRHAYNAWEGRLDEDHVTIGDLDGPLPSGERCAYTKLMELYNESVKAR